jgi:hypothetical protein
VRDGKTGEAEEGEREEQAGKESGEAARGLARRCSRHHGQSRIRESEAAGYCQPFPAVQRAEPRPATGLLRRVARGEDQVTLGTGSDVRWQRSRSAAVVVSEWRVNEEEERDGIGLRGCAAVVRMMILPYTMSGTL